MPIQEVVDVLAGLPNGLVLGATGIQVVEAIPTHGEALFATIVEHDHEGVIAKRLDAPYRAGRLPHWLHQEQVLLAPRRRRVAPLADRRHR